jgi:hypothetical protein
LRLIAVLIVFGTLPVGVADAQEPLHLLVEELQVPTGEPQLQTVAAVVTDTVALSLRLMGEYTVVRSAGGAKDQAVDRIVGGQCVRDPDGTIRFLLHLSEEGGEDPLFEGEHEAESLFDIFEVADAAALSVLEAINRRTVRFGTLRLEPSRDGATYGVFLNGEGIATAVAGTYENRRIVEGDYDLVVSSDGVTGSVPVFRTTVSVTAAEPAVVTVDIPDVQPEEISYFRERGVGRWSGGTLDTDIREPATRMWDELVERELLPPQGPVRSFLEHAVMLEGHDDGGTGDPIDPGAFAHLRRFDGGVRDLSGTRLRKVFPDTVPTFLRENVIDVDRYWKPQLSVHVGPEEVLLGASVDGIAGADRVTVDGPRGSGIVAHELRDGGSISPYGNGVYDDFLLRPDRVEPGDTYRFAVQRMGTTIVLDETIRSIPTELVRDVTVRSTPEGYLLEWRNNGSPVRHTIIVSAPEHEMPPPGAWQWSTDIAGDRTSFTVPRRPLGLQGDRRIHLFSADRDGNRVWVNRRFYHGPYRQDTLDVTERTIEVDGDSGDWRGIAPIASSLPSDGAPRRASGRFVERMYLAADDTYLYWAVSTTDRGPGSFIPQVQIYNSFDANGQHDAALLAMVRSGRTGEVVFDHWSVPSRRKTYTQGIRAASAGDFLEMRIPREYIDLPEFELDLVAREREGGEFSRLVDNFYVRLR